MTEESIFIAALQKEDAAERAAFLHQACAGDEALRQRIERLLRRHEQPDSLLDAPAAEVGVTVDRPSGDRPGAVIGPYKLVQPIGEGGMGTVFMAEQTRPVKRLVALKLIKAGLDSRQVLARFEAERQALALMDHPNIAKVLDAGTTEQGRPYFVMDLVKGIPITQFCDERRLTPRERLELAIPVCQAVQHAHQKGVIHRDLKPSNVLVALYDDRPVPKVIDFGVAKATGPRLTEQTLYTEFGSIVGTLEYMSPEQAQLNQLDIDTRSDIYSLGVLLYELLTGRTPLERKRLKEAAFLEALRLVSEQESQRPSRRLSTTEELPSIAACRSIEPRKLSRLVRGDLDWIVMKALEKDRNRRYETASGLAADLRRYLDDEPVQAGPPSAVYRFLKFARRNKRAMATAALLALMLLAAIGSLAISNLRIARKQEELETNLYFSRIALAERELAASHGARAEELLDQCRADRRGWEWHLLKRRIHEEPLALPGHTKAIRAVAFSPDGRVLASVSLDGFVRFWDPRSGTCRRLELTGGPPTFARAAFSPDGRRLAADIPDGSVMVWDLAANQGRLLKGHAGRVQALAFSPDGRSVAAACEDGTVMAWDLSDGEKTVLFRHDDTVQDVAYSADGMRLASASEDRTARVWDVQTGRPPWNLVGHQSGVLAVIFSPDGRTLATGARDGTVRTWDATTGRPIRVLRGHNDGVDTLAFSPDGKRLVSAAWDTTLRVWDPVTGQEALTLRDHTLGVTALAFSRDGRHMASGGYVKGDPGLRVWNATPLTDDGSPEALRVFAEPTQQVNCVAFSPDGSLLASGGDDKTVRVRDAATGQVKSPLGGRNEFNAVAFSPDETHLAACDDNGFVQVWDIRTGREVFSRRIAPYSPNALSYSPEGRRLAVAVPGGFLRVLEAATGKDDLVLDGELTYITAVAFSPDGQHLASTGFDKIVRVWDMGTHKARLLPGHEAGVNSVAYHPDGKSLATADGDGIVLLWDATAAHDVRRIRAHRDAVNCVRFSPDGRRLATASRDGTVKCWDTRAGGLLCLLRAHQRGAKAVAFHPDGRQLASAGADGTVKIWAVPTFPELPDQTR
jgi:WD40 repeat protein/serine/threonine protein kinase